jgi:Effector Associated Constant Component 1
MELRIELAAGLSGDLVRDLHEWLDAESESVGVARVRQAAPIPGALGPVADAVEVALGSVGALSSLAGVIIAWLQYRKPDLELTIFVDDRHDPVRVSALQAQQDPRGARSALTALLGESLPVSPETDGAAQDAG